MTQIKQVIRGDDWQAQTNKSRLFSRQVQLMIEDLVGDKPYLLGNINVTWCEYKDDIYLVVTLND